jgi:hypothetical protein
MIALTLESVIWHPIVNTQLKTHKITFWSQDSIVSIVTTLLAGPLKYHGSILSKGKRFFSLPKHHDYLWGPLSLLFSGYEGIFCKSKAAKNEAGHSLPFSAKVRNEG